MSSPHQETWRVREPWLDEAPRLARHFQVEARRGQARRLGALVIEAGDPERLVGLANWGEVRQPPAQRVFWMEWEVRPLWRDHAAAEALLDATIARVRDAGGDELTMRVAADGVLHALARRRGFVERSRQEALNVPVAVALAQLEDRGGRIIEREPVVVFPLMQANLAQVKCLCAETQLLPAERVHPVGPGMSGGFEPALSFFIGEPDEPAAVLLGREQAGVAYLEVLASDPKARRSSASGVLALMRAFFRSVHALKLEEVTCAVRPESSPGLIGLIRRAGATRRDAVAVLRLVLTDG